MYRVGRAHIMVSLLVLSALAGCSGPSNADEPPSNEPNAIATGGVHGLVLDIAGQPVPFALVTILSVESSATSDAVGQFNFTSVSKGEQTLRVEKVGYKTIQRPFTVAAGKVVKIEVVLARLDGMDGGSVEHYHDLWRGQELYTVFDGRLQIEPDMTQVPPTICTYPDICLYAIYPIDLGERIVPPGTTRLTVDISFEPGPLFEQDPLRFAIHPPPGPSGEIFSSTYWTITERKYHIEYTFPIPELTDHGHAKYSNWGFLLYIVSSVRGYTWASAYDLLFTTPVDLIINAHKGELAIDPPHPQYWKAGNVLQMPTGAPTTIRCTVAGQSAADTCEKRSPNPAVEFRPGNEARSCYQGGCMVLDRGGLVPPGTTRISFDLEVAQVGTPTGLEPPAGMSNTEWVLGFKTALAPRGGATWEDYTWVDPIETYLPEPQSGHHEQQGMRYTIDIPKGAEDPYYATQSTWVFMMAVRGHETAGDWSDISCGHYPCGDARFEMKNFRVHHDPAATSN